jgi:cell division protein ZapE
MARTFEAMRTGPTSRRSSRSRASARRRRRAGSAIWFDFEALCDGPRSQRDYLELAQRFAVLFLSGIPVMKADQGDLARRFTWLVDILYDHRVKLVASAEAPAEKLYVEGRNAQEFPRTVSRLTECAREITWRCPHASEEAPGTASSLITSRRIP